MSHEVHENLFTLVDARNNFLSISIQLYRLVFQIRFSVSAKKVGFTAFSARNRLG